MSAIQWGTLGEWVGGGATAAGLFFAAYEIRSSKRQRETEDANRKTEELERREAMARAVGFRVVPDQDKDGQWHVRYEVNNGGDYPISNAVLVIADPGQRGDLAEQVGTALEVVIGSIMSRKSFEGSSPIMFTRPPAFSEMLTLGGILFSDTWDQHWFSSSHGLVRRSRLPRMC
jgi:hypothetical protein